MEATRIGALFRPDARLASAMPGYVYRDQQVALSSEIAETFEQGTILLAEAETGTGKTMAYLVPALHLDGKVLISTHTRALQDQLVHRDIPAVQQALGISRSIALLKGRANYLCPFRLEKFLTSGQMEIWAQKPMLAVRDWAETTRDGDLAGLPFDVFERGVGPMVTATAEQCTGSKCPMFSRCPLMKARQKAQEADIVVTNHSLLLADAALKSGDFGELLPPFDAYVLDEAHSLPGLACQHFGVQLTRHRLIQWFNDMQAVLEEFGDESSFKSDMAVHASTVLDAWLKPEIAELQSCWKEVVEAARSRTERSDELEKLTVRAEQIGSDIATVLQPESGFVAWSEGEGETRRHLVAPIDTGPVLRTHLWEKPASFVLLSATLRVSGGFAYARERFGLADADEAFHPSPFDYGRQALVYLPRQLPDPRSDAGIDAMVAEMETLLRASRGRAFVLFTAYQMLNRVAPLLADRLPWTVLIQGKSGSRDSILERFREDTHSILCGTRSFWEGVDVPGEALSMVIIDKVPFAPPNDPLLRARIAHCEEGGGNGFRDIQLPEAIAVLRQGVGRLIRNEEDRGVLAILDSRLYTRSYGHEIVRNLPGAPIRDDLAEVRWFFEDAC
ncbi:MAG TPA: ATP-dependent DNA helicase [Mariprofundaceae bacterium]|nr:ATP-dependent DNA helicase [Mariprofundaceae bacterium]